MNLLKKKIKLSSLYINEKDNFFFCKKDSSNFKKFNNSVYFYNKTYLKNLINLNFIINNFIKFFFDLTFVLKDKAFSYRQRIRLKRSSTKRIFVSKSILNHFNNVIIIYIYLYNREKNYLLKKINKLYKNIRYNKYIRNIKSKSVVFSKHTRKVKSYRHIKNIRHNIYKHRNRFYRYKKNITQVINSLFYKKVFKYRHNKKTVYFNDSNLLYQKKLNKEKTMLFKLIKLKYINSKLFNFFIFDFNSEAINILLKKYKLLLHYKKLLLLNEYKSKKFFLLKFKELVEKIFNKKVEFKLINLKKLYLNSDIFMQSLKIKLKNRKNNSSVILAKSLRLVTIPRIDEFSFISYKKKFFNLINLNDYVFFNKNFKQKKIITKKILSFLKYKYVNGVKLEVKGRLTHRLTAQKSVFKTKSRGSLKNIYFLNKFNLIKVSPKSNLQYTNLNYKNRNGSFGLKG